MSERDEQNLKLAEWLGLTPKPKFSGGYFVPDFFADEVDSAMLLEKMQFAVVPMTTTAGKVWCVGRQFMNGTIVMWGSGTQMNVDRKTAIALAALKLIEKEKSCK